MYFASFILGLMILTAPIMLLFDGNVLHGIITSAAAASVATVALRIRPGEAGFLSTMTFRFSIIAAVPALWMLIQTLPLDIPGLSHPIWKSAAAAIERPLVGSISIDPGATLLSLAQYLSTAAIAFITAAVAADRYRAGWILLALVAAATLIALIVLVAGTGSFTFLSTRYNGPMGIAASDGAALGVMLAAAAALHALEQRNLEPSHQRESAAWSPFTFAGCLGAFAACSLAVLVSATTQIYFAVSCGVAAIAAVIVIRRFHLGPWGYAAIVSVALVVVIVAVAPRLGTPATNIALAFSDRAPEPLIAATQRILTDTGWAGTGAGTFSAILPIYRGIDELSTGSLAPTAAAATAVEMGLIFLLFFLMTAIGLVFALLRGAVHRGRDFIYSTAGASCVVTFMVLAFGNVGVFSTPVLVIIAAVVGISIAQRKGRSV